LIKNDVYTHGHQAAAVEQHARRTAESCASFARAYIRRDSDILDIGCGPASITVGLANWADQGSVTGIEPEKQILIRAGETVAKAGVKNIRLDEASVYELPYEDDAFDLAYAHQVLQHLTDPVLALKEMKRVVKPGGFIAVRDADYYTMCSNPESLLIDKWRRIYRQVARHNGAEPDAGRYLYGWCGEAGLSDLLCTASVWVFAEIEDRLNWGNSWAERCVATSFGQQAIEYGYATSSEMQEISDGWKTWAGLPTGYFHFIHGEVIGVVTH
jgi:ubiquinone/menaquinone biosynthesis C-methylase UbiE|tara:strand:- start:5632 stop:6444 length:813 start_codon:yes stop_codon:yes gene_type:complete